MDRKGFPTVVAILIVASGLAIASAVVYSGSGKGTPSIAVTTQSVSPSGPEPTSTSSPLLSSFWYQGKQLPVGAITIDGVQADILPVQPVTGATIRDQKTYEWQGMQLENYSGNQTVYTVDDVTITNSDGKVSVVSANEPSLYFKTFAEESGLYAFTFQGSEYFLESSQDCGQTCAKQFYLIRRNSDGVLTLVEPSSSAVAPWWNGSPESNFVGVLTVGDKLYLVDSQNSGTYTAILDASGFERMVFTSSSAGAVDLGDLVSTLEPTSTPSKQPSIWGEYHVSLPDSLIFVDSQGRRTGKDPLTGTSYHEIPGTSYIEVGSAATGGAGELLTSNLPNGRYTLYVIGGQSGTYWLDASHYNQQDQHFGGSIQAGSMAIYVQNYNMGNIASSTFSFAGTSSSSASITSAPPNNLPLGF